MNMKTIITGIIIGFIFLYFYKYYKQESFSNSKRVSPNTKDSHLFNDSHNYNLYTDKHVRFNDNIDIYEFEKGLRYSKKDNYIIDDKHLNNIVDDLLDNNSPIVEEKTNISEGSIINQQELQPLNSLGEHSTLQGEKQNKLISCLKPVNSVDKNKMFDELESEINQKYEKYSENELYLDIDRPSNPTNILNSNKFTMNDVNPVINPYCYTNALANPENDNLTIWEKYDNMTTNNFKEFNKLDKLEPNLLAPDKWNINDNTQYGSRFDNFNH